MDLREIRKNLKLNQEEFGNLVGFSRHTIMNWEKNGDIPPAKVEIINKILDKMNYSDKGTFEISGLLNEPVAHYQTKDDEIAFLKRMIALLERTVAEQEKIIQAFGKK